jgi:ATP-dependent Clp endopeptidase proteolytic subunit ClpP
MKVKNLNYEIKNAAASTEVDVMIYDTIGEKINWMTWSLEGVTYKSFENDFNEAIASGKKINLRINSEGGNVHAGLSIYNLINRNLENDVHVYVDGVAYSMAAIIMQAVAKGNRHMAKNGMLMLHSASSEMYGSMNAAELRKTADVLDKYDDILSESIAENMGSTSEDVKAKYFNGEDHLFTAKEALAAGLIDNIVDNKPTETNPIEKLTNEFKEFTAQVKSMVTNFSNKSQNIKIMNLDQVHNILLGDAPITAEQRMEIATIVAQYNTAKYTNEEVDQKVTEATQPLETRINELEEANTEIQNKLDAASLGGGAPNGGGDSTIVVENKSKPAYQPIEYWK